MIFKMVSEFPQIGFQVCALHTITFMLNYVELIVNDLVCSRQNNP